MNNDKEKLGLSLNTLLNTLNTCLNTCPILPPNTFAQRIRGQFLVVRFRVIAPLLLCLTYSLTTIAADIEKQPIRTGLTGNRGMLSVAPDGSQLLFTTEKLAHGLRLADLRSNTIQVVPTESNRIWEMPNWSHDGKQVVAVSTSANNNSYDIGDQQLVLIDPTSWRHRTITSGNGVKIFPFFSADGKSVYFFKGVKRLSGKTPASRYDLYAIDLINGREQRLTQEAFYQVGRGDDDGDSLVFSATPNFKKGVNDAFGVTTRNALFQISKKNKKISMIRVDQRIGIFDFYMPLRDKVGNVYFVAAKANSSGGAYLWFAVQTARDGTNPVTLIELPVSMGFGIAREAGEIWAMDRVNNEIVLRSLRIPVGH